MTTKKKKTQETQPQIAGQTSVPLESLSILDCIDRHVVAHHQACAIADLIAHCDPNDLNQAENQETLAWAAQTIEKLCDEMKLYAEQRFHLAAGQKHTRKEETA
ncbi:MAG TPA: hypothetical protein VG206_13930 [Terriglobia bacterium]|nr:hypothetical protein [Terriglobia bacterium]